MVSTISSIKIIQLQLTIVHTKMASYEKLQIAKKIIYCAVSPKTESENLSSGIFLRCQKRSIYKLQKRGEYSNNVIRNIFPLL